MENVENQNIKLDDYSRERLNNVCCFYGLSVGTFFITDPVKVVCSMLASLQMRSMGVSKAYKELIQVDISFLKGLLYDLSR